MTRGSEVKVKIKARDETHSDKVIKKLSSCTVKKKPYKKGLLFVSQIRKYITHLLRFSESVFKLTNFKKTLET